MRPSAAREHRPSPPRGVAARAALGAAVLAALTWRLAGQLRRRHHVHWRRAQGREHRGVLAARVLGSQGSPIVLLHGQAGSGRYWGGHYDQLAGHGRLVVPDLLGFGRSPWPAVTYDPDTHADAVLACLDELGFDEPAVLVAHSLGCVVALRVAARHPERVSAVLGFGPPLYRDPGQARRQLSGVGLGMRLFAFDTPLAQLVHTRI
jgi:pimeloyl-ACP methyl ester carboxylesterase